MSEKMLDKLLKSKETREELIKKVGIQGRVNELIEIRKELAQIREQQDLTPILERLDRIEQSLESLTDLMKTELRLSDKEEAILELLKKKLEKG